MSTRLPAGSVAAARHVTDSCRDFTLDRVKFRVVCRGNLEIGLESDTQVGLLAISLSSKLTNKGYFPIYFDVLNNFSPMHIVDWKPMKVGNGASHRSVENIT